MNVRTLTVVLLGAFLLLPLPARAQDPGIEAALQEFLSAWQAGDGATLESVLIERGVSLRMGSDAHGPVRPRQAAAALRQYMADRTPGQFNINRVSHAGGEPERGFAEVEWRTVVKGTSEPVGYTVFVGLERSQGRWAIQEVRILG